MDELSWRAQLAKSNINILNIVWNDDRTIVDVFYEFMYHPYSGSTKWSKTWTQVAGKVVRLGLDDNGAYREMQREVTGNDIARTLKTDTLKLRKELEG